ncbi:hypothetical protein [Neorhizobium galegae]|uniref:hypothetical protein n=1 Tax=Neorhizobium galegae TaxID=399 RepID=UPI00062192A0|nr:hypothetical protein [Neorhizobium galegae]CDZ55409.1 Hypothetical protein NGAL_HAMBI2427_62090 [Neorhizobium galegae bv. orientalis]
MTCDQHLMLYARLAGFRLVVLANRFGCEGDFSKRLHDWLLEGLDAAIDRIRIIIELERRLFDDNDEFTAYQLAGEIETFRRFTIDLLDEIVFDYDTYEYRINDGEWIKALTADHRGVDIDYPSSVALTEEELGSLGQIIDDIVRETGIPVHANRIAEAQNIRRPQDR